MRKLMTIFFSLSFMYTTTALAQWQSVTTDPSGDGSNPNLLDGTDLSYYYSKAGDSLYFKIKVTGFTSTTEQAVGVNVMVNIPGGGSTFNFWGNNNMNAFHKLITVWVTGTPPSSYSGTIGIANAAGVNSSTYDNLSSGNIDINVDNTANEITLGLKREDLITDTEMGGNTLTAGIAAAVGSNMSWNDDLYDPNAMITIDKTPTGIEDELSSVSEIAIYPNPVGDNGYLDIDLSTSSILSYEIVNLSGQKIVETNKVNLQKGKQRLELNTSGLENGVYFIRVYKDDKPSETLKFIK